MHDGSLFLANNLDNDVSLTSKRRQQTSICFYEMFYRNFLSFLFFIFYFWRFPLNFTSIIT